MPRIAAAFGAVALIVFSLGVNITRYPKVWEMVDPAAHLSVPAQSSESLQASATAEPPAPSQPVLCELPSSQPATQDYPAELAWTGPDETPETQWEAKSAPPATRYASQTAESDDADLYDPEKRLVRVVRPEALADSAESLDSGNGLVRLPPVDPSDPHAALVDSLRDWMPSYPATRLD